MADEKDKDIRDTAAKEVRGVARSKVSGRFLYLWRAGWCRG